MGLIVARNGAAWVGSTRTWLPYTWLARETPIAWKAWAMTSASPSRQGVISSQNTPTVVPNASARRTTTLSTARFTATPPRWAADRPRCGAS